MFYVEMNFYKCLTKVGCEQLMKLGTSSESLKVEVDWLGIQKHFDIQLKWGSFFQPCQFRV